MKRSWLFYLLIVVSVWLLLQLIYVGVTFARYHSWKGQSVLPDSSGQGNGKVSWVLVHGFGDSPNVWDQLAPELLERGQRVVRIRLDGWGEDLSQKQTVEVDTWRRQICAAVTLEQDAGRQVFLAAHSMGGCVVANLLLDGELNGVGGVNLYAPMFGISNVRSPLLTARQWQELSAWAFPLIGSYESIFPDHMRQNSPRDRRDRDPFVSRNVYGILFDQIDAAHQSSGRITVPMRIMVPGEDRVVDSEQTRIWKAEHAPDAAWVVAENAGHTLPLDIDPDAEARMLLAWAQQHEDER